MEDYVTVQDLVFTGLSMYPIKECLTLKKVKLELHLTTVVNIRYLDKSK